MNSIFDNVILTDYDGVCVTWSRAFAFWMLENGYGLPKEGYYEIHDSYGITEKESRLLSKMFNESAVISKLPPLRDAIKYIRKLHEEHGYVFHCISAVPDLHPVREARWKNIKALFGETTFERLILCDSSKNKPEHLLPYKDSGCFWIEDLWTNAMVGVPLGLNCLLMDHHYNKGFSHPEVKRVKNWKEIYNTITGEL
jgi:hypothetical protein